MNKIKSFISLQVLSLLIIQGLFVFMSCSDDKTDDANKPEEPQITSYTLRFKSSEIVEFKQMQSKQNVGDIPFTDSEKYFGKRIQLNTPTELSFKDDSLFITKPNELKEFYKVKWQSNDLFLFDDTSNEWKYCGTKDQKGRFLLNTGFYIQKSKDKQRTLTVLGQEYSLKSYSELLTFLAENESSLTSSIMWLKKQYIFE